MATPINGPLFLALLALSTLATAAEATPPPPKHIVFFVIDDYGFADASYKKTMYNGTAPPPTPHIDALALNGVRLESHYVNKLCSPTRTALLSGRYAYTNGQDDGVIIDGQNVDMPLNLKTIADHLQEAGWKTSSYGKWDAGCTTWGSTPTCRGFDHFSGFYSAASDYFTHMVGAGFDYHRDVDIDVAASGVYTTQKVTSAVQAWITSQVQEHANSGGEEGLAALKTFAYVAHEAVHGPMEVPASYLDGPCSSLVPKDHPIRLIYCGMVRAVDESVKNITATYEALGILNETVFIMTGDNGGIPQDGGNNFPLRGNKATTFEGGVRSIAWISGAGLDDTVRGSVSHELMHVTDWLPTIVGGIAGLDLSHNTTGRPCPTCTRPVAALDGFDLWPTLSTPATPSPRTEVLLDLQAVALNKASGSNTRIPGSGAIRVGKWKLLHGHQGVWPGQCTLRQAKGTGPTKHFPPSIPITPATQNPWCPFGWTPPPHSGPGYAAPEPPPEYVDWPNCTAGQLPCHVPPTSGYVAGQTLLFDVVNDMFERHDVAAENPAVVKRLLAKLQAYNDTHCGGKRCEPDNAGGHAGAPVGSSGPGGKPVWLPWRGNLADPGACDTNRTDPHAIDPLVAGLHSSMQTPTFARPKPTSPPALRLNGWVWDGAWAGRGLKPMRIRVSVDGDVVVPSALANVARPELPSKTGAPNPEHGFLIDVPAEAVATLAGKGEHRINVDVYLDESGGTNRTAPVGKSSPTCFKNGNLVHKACGGSAGGSSDEEDVVDFDLAEFIRMRVEQS